MVWLVVFIVHLFLLGYYQRLVSDLWDERRDPSVASIKQGEKLAQGIALCSIRSELAVSYRNLGSMSDK